MTDSKPSLLGRLAAQLTRLATWLFAPSLALVDPVDRRRARLLAKLAFMQSVQLLSGVALVKVLRPPDAPASMAQIFSVALLGVLIAYGLSRTRRLAASIGLFVVVASLISPAAMFVATDAVADTLPRTAMGWQLLPILLVSVMVSARAAAFTALGSLCACLLAVALSPRFALHDDAVVSGSLFLLWMSVALLIFSVHSDNTHADRAAELRNRNAELEGLRETLEQRVAQRTEQLSARNADMRLLLDHVGQGIFSIDGSGQISTERSAQLGAWFGAPEQGERFTRYFAKFAPRFAEMSELAWEQVEADVLPIEVALDMLPGELAVADRYYRVSYQPISLEPELRVLVVMTDVTDEVIANRAEVERKETLAMLEHVLADRQRFQEFIDEGSALVAAVSVPQPNAQDLKRALHTLKGNALLMGIRSVSELCHNAEESLDEGAGQALDVSPLVQRWQRITGDLGRLLGERRNSIEISTEQRQALAQATEAGAPREQLLRLVSQLGLEPAEARLRHFAEHALRLAERLGKEVRVEVDAGEVYLDNRPWTPVWAAFVHAVRNAVDHGIESAAERKARNKPEAGRIVLRARRAESHLIFEIEDDGRGIAWEAVRERSAAQGLKTASQADLEANLFVDGLSTKASVSDISGRGVGLGALRAPVLELGGTLQISSEAGRGTCLRLVFDACAPADRAVA